jgi:hypothetical protein
MLATIGTHAARALRTHHQTRPPNNTAGIRNPKISRSCAAPEAANPGRAGEDTIAHDLIDTQAAIAMPSAAAAHRK